MLYSCAQQWRRRFFVLYAPPWTDGALLSSGHSAFLHYYESEKITKKKGSIDLESCEELLDRLENKCYPHLFSLRTSDHGNLRTYFMAADTEAEMDEWVDQLLKILDLRSKFIESVFQVLVFFVKFACIKLMNKYGSHLNVFFNWAFAAVTL